MFFMVSVLTTKQRRVAQGHIVK